MQESSAQKKKSIKVPNLPKELLKDQILDSTYLTSNIPPFYSTTERIVSEKDNTDPNFLRSTMYILPTSEYSLECISLPLALIATPFNDRGSLEYSSGIDSCTECRTIFNNFTKTENSSFTCNICGKNTTFLPKFVENLGFSSFEVSLSENTNLNKKIIGYDPSNQNIEYPFIKELLKPSFFFIFDLSSSIIIERVVKCIREILRDENFQILYENVGFFIINNGITVFSGKNGNLICHKIKENSSFISPKCTVKSSDHELISLILNEILNCPDKSIPDHKSIVSAIKSISSFTVTSKIAIFSSCDVNFNYESILADRFNFSVNTFSINSEPQNISKLGTSLDKLAFFSSGKIFKYTLPELCYLEKDLKSICINRSAYNINMILKVSDNLIKRDVVSSCLNPNMFNSQLNHMDSNTAVTFLLGLDGVSKLTKYIQLQVYFTDYDGSRKLRVFNHIFHTGTPMQVYSNCSFDTIFASMVKNNLAHDEPLEKNLVKSLACYKEKCSSNPLATQLILPECIKCLPVLVQAFLKKINLEKAKLINANVEQVLRYFYPRLFSLSDYVIDCDLLKTKQLNLTFSSLTEDDIFILENSFKIFVYVPKNTDKMLIERLFEEKPDGYFIRSGEEEESVILRSIIDKINEHYNQDLRVVICFAGQSISEGEFISNLIEDPNNSLPDFIDYIFKLHYQVQKGK